MSSIHCSSKQTVYLLATAATEISRSALGNTVDFAVGPNQTRGREREKFINNQLDD